MSDEDRFGDLGAPREPAGDGRSAAERLEEEDRLRPEADDPQRRPPEVRGPGNKYAWVVGIVMLMGIGVLLLTTAIPNQGAAVLGPPPGKVLLEFAAPLATGNIDCESDEAKCAVNLCQKATKDDCTEASGRTPACEVRGDSIFNICELRRKPLVLTFLVTDGADCEPQVDRVERLSPAFPQVQFAAVVSGEGREEVEQIVRRRGWEMPVAVDFDGQLTNLYGLGVCPTTVFAYPGGKVRRTRLGNLTEEQLRRQVEAIVR